MLTLAGSAVAVFVLLYLAGFVAAGTARVVREANDPDSLEEKCVRYGAILINDGYLHYPDWSNMMIREFGDSIEEELQRFHKLARPIADEPRDQWAESIRNALGITLAEIDAGQE